MTVSKKIFFAYFDLTSPSISLFYHHLPWFLVVLWSRCRRSYNHSKRLETVLTPGINHQTDENIWYCVSTRAIFIHRFIQLLYPLYCIFFKTFFSCVFLNLLRQIQYNIFCYQSTIKFIKVSFFGYMTPSPVTLARSFFENKISIVSTTQ